MLHIAVHNLLHLKASRSIYVSYMHLKYIICVLIVGNRNVAKSATTLHQQGGVMQAHSGHQGGHQAH